VERLDFIEDPWVWNPQAWAELKSRFGVRLAGDRETQSLGASELEDAMKSGVVDLQVLKPAVQEWPGTKRRVVFTSYLDHPLGQMSAAYVAANTVADQNISAGVEVCGLLSHRAYEANPFSELLCVKGAFLKPAGGMGLGFDELLAKLSWEKLGALRS
jgi:O-succinylbenzoate synthase